MAELRNIVVVGAGTMGRGIAHVAALGGYHTTLQDVSKPSLNSSREMIEKNLEQGVKLGKVTQEQQKETLSRLQYETSLEAAAKHADVAIEAVPEQVSLKQQVFSKLHQATPSHCIFATNTSALSVSEMARTSGRPDRFVGMHFFNPVYIMKLVEVVLAETTSETTLAASLEVAKRMGKETVQVRESPGFVTTRMNALIGNEAFRMLESGIASARDIDKALKLGLNHPMGPFEMIDLVGLDTRLSILTYLHDKLGELYEPSPLLRKLVSEGRLGKKVGKGIYDYGDTSSAGKGGPGRAK